MLLPWDSAVLLDAVSCWDVAVLGAWGTAERRAHIWGWVGVGFPVALHHEAAVPQQSG